jgi:hypothetical protein
LGDVDVDDNIKMDLKEIGCENLAQFRNQWQAVVNMLVNIGFHKSGEYLDQLRKCKLPKEDSAA